MRGWLRRLVADTVVSAVSTWARPSLDHVELRTPPLRRSECVRRWLLLLTVPTTSGMRRTSDPCLGTSSHHSL